MRHAAFCTVIVGAVLVLSGATPATGQQLQSTNILGGSGGRAFSDLQPPAGARVMEVRVRAGDQVDSVQMVYALPDGRTETGPRHGGSGGGLNTFRLDPDEYIVGLSGRYGDQIDSLRIHTNRRTSPLFGGRGGDRDYRIEVPAWNLALGFSGRSGDLLDAVGLTFGPIPRSTLSTGGDGPRTSLAGGRGGSPFTDRDIPADARIVEVRVRAGDLVESVQVVYILPDGRSIEGARHGGSGGRGASFRLDPDEYIVGLSGRYGDYVDSLRIHTNKRTSQLFGGRGGDRDYRVDVPSGTRAAGFIGRSGDYVDAIGLSYSAAAPAGPDRRFRPRRRP